MDYREDELQLQKLKKRKVKVDPRLSFCDDIENSNEEEDVENSKLSFSFSDLLICNCFSMLSSFDISCVPLSKITCYILFVVLGRWGVLV